MSSTPAPTPHIASVGLQVQVFICYTICSVGVAYFIWRLARSLCKKQSDDETVETAEVDTVKAKGKKIIFWTSFITIGLFFYRSILIWGGMLYHLVDEDDNVTNNFAFSISFAGYGLGLWLMLLTFVVRIDYTFRGSFLAYSARTIYLLYGLVFFMLAWVLILVAFEFADAYDVVVGWLLPLILDLHFLFFVLLSCLLSNKIFILMRTKVHQCEDRNKEKEKEETEKNADMAIDLSNIDAFTRFGLLMSIGISSTYVLTMMSMMTLRLPDRHPIRDAGVVVSLIGGDLFVNALMVYLLFNEHFTV